MDEKLALILEDISAAKLLIESLRKQKADYLKAEETLNFQRDETSSKLHELRDQNQHNADSFKETFFTYLNRLEQEEAGLTGEIQSNKGIYRNLHAENAKNTQLNKRLKSECNRIDEAIDREEMRKNSLSGELEELRSRIIQKRVLLSDLQDACRELKGKAELHAELVNQQSDSAVEALRKQIREKENSIEELKSIQLRKQEEWNRQQRFYDKTVSNYQIKITKQQGVSSWLNDRSLLVGKLRRAKERLERLTKSLDDSKQRKDALQCKFGKLLDGEVDGSEILARKMVEAEINEIQRLCPTDISHKLSIERQYNKTLESELAVVNESLTLFSMHRTSVISDLKAELESCAHSGYIDLLDQEKRALQTAVFKT